VNDHNNDPIVTSRACEARETIAAIAAWQMLPQRMIYIKRVVLAANVNCSGRAGQGRRTENVS
jgi:hypothetical protein